MSLQEVLYQIFKVHFHSSVFFFIFELAGFGWAVIGGEFSRDGEYPFAISLLRKNQQFCSGVLVDHEFVLSTCHCVGVFHLGYFESYQPDDVLLVGGDPWVSGKQVKLLICRYKGKPRYNATYNEID